MDKINPLLYITDVDPIPETVLDASGWFETEYISVDTVYVQKSGVETRRGVGVYLQWFLAQGWLLYESTEGIEVTSTEFKWDGTIPPSGTITYPSFETIGYDWWTTSVASPLGGWVTYRGRYVDNGLRKTTYSLKRRKLQSERVLQSLITDFTGAYNEGREINDRRYDELVTLYSVLLDKSEDQLTADAANDTTYEGLIEAIITGIGTDHSSYAADVDGALDDYGDSIRLQINNRFDAQLATARQGLVDRCMYNSTVWDSISSGVERERSLALSDVEDKITQQQLALKHKIHDEAVSMRSRVLAARDRLHSQLQAASDRALTVRNAILSAMFAFMERRQDDYPSLSGIADIAAKLGYGDSPNTVMP